MTGFLVSALLGYFLGSIPFGLLVGKMRGIDIRQHGSGNIGATNVSRTLGKKWGIFVFALDALKGFVAVRVAERWIAPIYGGLGESGEASSLIVQLGITAAVACIIGHNFPIWLKFKGGKGVATSAGVVFGVVPIAALTALVSWVIVFYSTRYVSLASMVAGVVIPLTVLVLEWQARQPLDGRFWFAVVVAVLALWRHRPNIQRLLAGTENRFEKKK